MPLTKKQKKSFFLFSILLIPLIALVFTATFIAESPFDEPDPDIYITDGDIIKNFGVYQFDGYRTNSKGEKTRYTVTPSAKTSTSTDSGITYNKLRYGLYGGRLKMEQGGVWKVDPDLTDVIRTHTVKNTTYIFYRLAMRNRFNFFTNIGIENAAEHTLLVTQGETGSIEDVFKDIFSQEFTNQEREEYLDNPSDYKVLRYRRLNWNDKEVISDREEEFIQFNHYDFGDIRNYNRRNIFEGVYQFEFDIDPSPFAEQLIGPDGDTYEKSFDYIAVSNVFISKTPVVGAMADAPPEIAKQDASDKTDDKKVKYGGFTGSGRYKGKKEFKYDINPKFKDPFPAESFPSKINPPSKLTDLYPRQKDDSPLFDPQNELKSMSGCRFDIPINRLSPSVVEWQTTLKFSKFGFTKEDRYLLEGPEFYTDSEKRVAKTKPAALQVTNNFIQVEVMVLFNIYTSYNLVYDSGVQGDLEKPKEYWNETIWSTTVDGVYEGTIQRYIGLGLFDIIIYIVMIIAIAVILIILVRTIIPRMLGKEKKKEKKGSK